jgi:hypothetical protein
MSIRGSCYMYLLGLQAETCSVAVKIDIFLYYVVCVLQTFMKMHSSHLLLCRWALHGLQRGHGVVLKNRNSGGGEDSYLNCHLTTSTVKCPDFSMCKISPDDSNGINRLN